MTRLESTNISKKSFLTVVDKLLKGEDIFLDRNDVKKKIGAKHKLYFGNYYLEMSPYKKDGTDRVSISIGYNTIQDRYNISKALNSKNNNVID